MKCSWCNKEESYWKLQPMSLTEDQKSYPSHIPVTKSLVCHTCLGWDKPRKVLPPKEKWSFKHIAEIASTFQNGHRSKKWCIEQALIYLEKHG